MRVYELCAHNPASKTKRREDTQGWNSHWPWTGSDTSTRTPRRKSHSSSMTPVPVHSGLVFPWSIYLSGNSAELKATHGEPVTQYTANCCSHINDCQDANFSPQLKDKRQSQLEKNIKHPENWSQNLFELRMARWGSRTFRVMSRFRRRTLEAQTPGTGAACDKNVWRVANNETCHQGQHHSVFSRILILLSQFFAWNEKEN